MKTLINARITGFFPIVPVLSCMFDIIAGNLT